MNINKAVVLRINELLDKYNISQYKLEQQSGILHGTMSGIMNEKNETVTLTTIFKLAKGFNMHFLEFLNSPVFDKVEFDT